LCNEYNSFLLLIFLDVIAAGSVLGRAGLWEGIVLFHDSVENRMKYGQVG